MRIDAHQHFWLMRDRTGQWPPAELAAIHRDFVPDDLQPVLTRCGIGGTVLVQSLPSVEDTTFLLDIADQSTFVRGVVGWLELKAPEAPAQIASLSAHPKLKGLRPMLQDIADVNWINDPILNPAIRAMISHELRFDALVMPEHLTALTMFAERHPDLPIVIDHGAKPRIAKGFFRGWHADMRRLAALPNVQCKLSGLLTEAGSAPGIAAIRPYAETLLDLFGERRLIWGSDWPVLNLAGSYEVWLSMCLDIVPLEHHDAVFGGNAIAFYGLESGPSQP
ncbi:amidohydrolase family protein [Microvirga rosea]|uniref:amidohydrolase family protein n=1 Tax=Microvirga rosea TaxID=2715425 RepID=UPI001D0AA336|nr:amidohydrolase family protein [Microvirga rosea]MCB8822205.1 amidohydrolase family protein [Microvirga rosea]